MNKSICNFLLFIILLVLAVLFFGCEKKEPPWYVVGPDYYVDTFRCKTIIAESGKTYYGRGEYVSGCVRSVSSLIHERDSLMVILKLCSDSRAADNSKELKVVYDGYIHPSGNYRWTDRGWLALKPLLWVSSDSTKIQTTDPSTDAGPYTPTKHDSVEWGLKQKTQ